MLQFFRSNAKGALGKTIVGAIVVVFSLWGATSIATFTTGNNAPVTVNGVDISEYEVSKMTDIQKRNIQAQLGDSFDPSLISDAMVRQSVIQNLVNQQLEWQAAQSFGMAMSDEKITEIIVQAPVFHVDGKFDKDTYTRVIGQYGYSPTDYMHIVRQDIINSQLKRGLINTGFVLDHEVTLVSKLESQTRDFSVLTIDPGLFIDQIELSDDDLLSFYEENKGQYRTEELIKVDYIVLNKDKLSETIIVSDEELEQAYSLYETQQSGNVEKSVSHILVTTEELSNSEAKQLANSLKDRIGSGESFSELAKEFSNDPGSAETGGDLGIFIPGMFVPEFEEAVNAMSAVGVVAGPVKTDFGYHLITLNSISEAEVESFESQKSRLMDLVLDRKVADELLVLQEDLTNIAFSEANLDAIADQFELTIETSEFFGRTGGSGIFAATSVSGAAFDPIVVEDDENSEVVSLSDGSLVVMHLNAYQEADYVPLADVKDRIAVSLKASGASQKATEMAEQMVSSLSDSSELTTGDTNAEWIDYQQVARNGSDVDASVAGLAFKMPKPVSGQHSIAQVPSANGTISIVALKSVNEIDSPEEDLAGIQNYLSSLVSESDFEQWFNGVASTAKIKYQ